MALFGASVILLFLVGLHCASRAPCPMINGELEIIEHSDHRKPNDLLEESIIGSIVGTDENSSEEFEPKTAIHDGLSVQRQIFANGSAWPTPTNVTVVKQDPTTAGNRASFEIRWSISSTVYLKEFRVNLCAPKCVNATVGRTQFRAELKVPFYMKFNTSVIAVFNPPNSTRSIEMSSNVSEHKSGFGAPNAIAKLNAKQEDSKRRLKIWWDRPSTPNGPIHHYSLQVSDSLDGNKREILTPQTIEATIDVAGMSGYGYEVIIQAVNIDPNTTKELASPKYEATLTYIKLSKPAAVVPIWTSRDSIHFEISRPNYRDLLPFPLYYKIKTRSHLKSNYVTQVAVIGRLNPFENVTIEVSTCYRTALFKKYICGEALPAKGTTNVAAPSRIGKVDLIRSPSNDTSLKWSLPDKPNGPINGFLVYIKEIVDRTSERATTTNDLDSTARSIEFTSADLVPGKSYEFAVAAYNRDPKTQEYYVGEQTIATPPAPPTAQAHWIIPVAVFSVIFVLCAVSLGVFFYVRSGRTLPRILNFSK